MTKSYFKSMTWPDIEQHARTCDIAIIPLGSMEPQQPHLPVGTDSYIIEALAERGAALVADEVGALVLPVFEFGSAVGPSLVPEALNLPWDVLLEWLVSIFADLYRQGFRRFVLVNGHGSTGVLQARETAPSSTGDDGKPRMGGEGYSYQTAFGFAYDAAAQFVENGPDVEMFFVSAGGFFRGSLPQAQAAWWQSSGEGDLPLQVKTSLMLALRPELVDLSQMPGSETITSRYSFLGDPRYGVGAVMSHEHFTRSTEGAASPQDVSAEIGQQFITIWTDKFALMLREMQAKAHLAGRYRADSYKSGQP